MALRNQPYLPLFVDDFLSDEKLSLCSAASTGVYIRLMCLMHKADEYGVILLKQRLKQNSKQTKNFACMFARQMPFSDDVIEAALDELFDENVIQIDGDRLIQKRMVRDEKLSNIRAFAGSKGGKSSSAKKQKFASNFAQAKTQANTGIGIVYVNENNPSSLDKKKGVKGGKEKTFIPPTLEEVQAYVASRGNRVDAQKFFDYFNEGGWIDSEGKPVKSWKQKVITWEGNRGRDTKPDTKPKPVRKLTAIEC